MPVNSRHPSYTRKVVSWEKCRKTYEGEEAIKEAGQLFLPKTSANQPDSHYQAYKDRALFYAAVPKTVLGMTGAAVRKDPTISVKGKMKDWLMDVDGNHTNIYEFIRDVVQESVLMGRVGIESDAGVDGEGPYLSLYKTESIINWEVDKNGKLIWLVLELQKYVRDSSDEYNWVSKKSFKEYYITKKGTFVQYHKETRGADNGVIFVQDGKAIQLKPNGKAINYIPFVIVNSGSLNPDEIANPPMLGIANINISHYRSSADLEQGRHFLALPTPWITGISDEDANKIQNIGPPTIWKISSTEAQVGMMEFNGQGLSALEKALEQKELLMGTLGAKLLETRNRNEAAETSRIRNSGENAVLSDIVSYVGTGIEMALRYIADWGAWNRDAVSVAMSQDFINEKLTSQEINAMLQALMSNAISFDTWWTFLQQGEIAPHDITSENEVSRIAKNQANLMPSPTPDSSDNTDDSEKDMEDMDDEIEEEEDS